MDAFGNIAVLLPIGLFVFMFALGLLPRLVRAQWKGQARSFTLGYGGDGIPIDVGGGYARMSLGNDQVRAHMVKADLQSRGILCRLDEINGGSTASVASTYILHFQMSDAEEVATAWKLATS